MTKYRILLVDDSPFMRKVFSDLIAACGMFEVVAVAGDGEEAVHLTQELAPDVVVMDLEMPKMNGIEALRQIMAVRPTPVIMMSAVTENGARDTIRALQSGAFDFVRKPDGAVGLDINLVSEMLCERMHVAAETSRQGKLRILPPAPQEEPPEAAARQGEEAETAKGAKPGPAADPVDPGRSAEVPGHGAPPAPAPAAEATPAAAPTAEAPAAPADKPPRNQAPAKRPKAAAGRPAAGTSPERPVHAPGTTEAGTDAGSRELPARSGKRPSRQTGKADPAGTAGDAGRTAAQSAGRPASWPRTLHPPEPAAGGPKPDDSRGGAAGAELKRSPRDGASAGTGVTIRRRTKVTPDLNAASADAPVLPKPARPSGPITRLVAVGTSTGGPRALHELLTALPADFAAPILIVQHMPPKFTRSLAQRLDLFCRIRVREAEDGDPVEAGTAYIAPGGMQMILVRNGPGQYRIRLTDDPPRNGHKPSVDVLFESLIDFTELERHAVLMTGMGSDGARGMKMLKEAGATTIAESEATCVVYGMPRSAVELGAATHVLPLPEIAPALIREVVHGIR